MIDVWSVILLRGKDVCTETIESYPLLFLCQQPFNVLVYYYYCNCLFSKRLKPIAYRGRKAPLACDGQSWDGNRWCSKEFNQAPSFTMKFVFVFWPRCVIATRLKSKKKWWGWNHRTMEFKVTILLYYTYTEEPPEDENFADLMLTVDSMSFLLPPGHYRLLPPPPITLASAACCFWNT